MSVHVRELRLQAFRAYPKSTNFPFPDDPGGSLLLFAPNGLGKSSITDAFEFLLHPDSTLDRLGLRNAELNSGRRPLRNTRSNEALPTLVELKIALQDGSKKTGAREARESATPIPSELAAFAQATVVAFIIRGPDLRQLVYSETPRDRYNDLARYIHADRLSQLQANIRSIETRLRQDADKHSEGREALVKELTTLTSASLRDWNEGEALRWSAALLQPHGLSIQSLLESDPTMATLRERDANERSSIVRSQVQQQIARINAISVRSEAGDLGALTGLRAWRQAVANRDQAVQMTAQASSSALIEAAISLLADPNQHPDACPVCGAPFNASPFGQRSAVIAHLEELRNELAALRETEAKVTTARLTWDNDLAALSTTVVQVIEAMAVTDQDNLRAEWRSCYELLKSGDDAKFETFVRGLEASRLASESLLASNPEQAATSGNLFRQINQLRGLKGRFEQWQSSAARRDVVMRSVTAARELIDREVYAFIASAVAAVEADVIKFYAAVQQFAPVPVSIHMNLMDVQNADARGLELLVDFPNAPGVKPRAYLSDSQINTLGLGLRLALIRKFNSNLPFVVLDDVVTSYDADYRRQIAKVLLAQFSDVQLVVLTHDEQFMRELRDRIEGGHASRWRIRQILKYDPILGPDLLDAPTDEGEIDGALQRNVSAANEIRQYVERHLMRVAEGIGARAVISRRPEYSHRELLDAVIEAANEYGLDTVLQTRPDFRELISELQKNSILNLGSHAVENPHRTGSVGDEKSLWEDVKRFLAVFKCSGCGKRRFEFNKSKKKGCCAGCGRFFSFELES